MKPKNVNPSNLKKITLIKKKIKNEISSNKKISPKDFINVLNEYKSIIKSKRVSTEFKEINKTKINLAILYSRLKIIGKNEKYTRLCLKELEKIESFFMSKEKMILTSKEFLMDIKKIPKEEMNYEFNFLKNITTQTVFRVNSEFNKIFSEVLKESQKVTDSQQLYSVLSTGNKKLINIYKNNKRIN